MENWKNLFAPWILARGREYYDCGQVVALKEGATAVAAEVSGSQLYHVTIHRAGERVSRMSCDCPYAAGGENCKHMAAVLMAMDRKAAPLSISWEAALAQMDENQLRELLHSLARENGRLQKRMIRMVSEPETAPERWQDDLEQIISDYTDYQGYLDYDHAYDCMVEVGEYLEENLPALLTDGQILNSAKLVMAVYDAAWSQDMDDSDGGLSIVSAYCQEALENILDQAEPQQEREIFELLHTFMKNSDWDYGSDNLEEVILSLNWSPEFQQKNLEYLDENLSSWRMNRRAEMMEQMGTPKAEVISWWEQQPDNDMVYHALLRLYEEEDLSKAIELVQGKREAKNKPAWQTASYTKTLLRLLEKSEDRDGYEKELRYLVLKLNCRDEEYVSSLKNITPAQQWPGVFETLVEGTKWPGDRMQLYHFEEKYSELFTELSSYPNLDQFQSYEEVLRNWDPQRTLQLYREILKTEMDRACARKQYHSLASHLNKLSSYPNGLEEAKTLAAHWHEYYKNRPAMKDELKKAGYPQDL